MNPIFGIIFHAIGSVFAGIVKTLLEKRHSGVVTWNLWDIKDIQHYARKNIVKIGLWDRNLRPYKPAVYRIYVLKDIYR